MSAAVEALLALASQRADRIEARMARARAACAALRQAQRDMDATCGAAVDRLSVEEFERLCTAEQAKVDAIRAPIDDVIERDLWPRHLYFGCL